MQQASGGPFSSQICTTTSTNITTQSHPHQHITVDNQHNKLHTHTMTTRVAHTNSPQLNTNIFGTSNTITPRKRYVSKLPIPSIQVDSIQQQTDMDITDPNIPWQRTQIRKGKRNRENVQNNALTAKKQAFDSNVNYIQNSNRFTVLSQIEPEGSPINNTEKRIQKPPPIFMENITNYPLMIESIKTVLSDEDFVCKTVSTNSVKINTNTSDAYRKIIHLLKQNEVAFHTYQPREERAYRVVIKNLHHTMLTTDIKEELEKKGFKIRNVTNIRSWKTKEPLPLFFVDQEPNDNNKEIYNLKRLLSTVIEVEPPRKKKEIPQCFRCQKYGHTKSYCTNPFYCVKCAENHPSNTCDKSRDIPPKCTLCDGSHPANYKGCSVYRDLQKARSKTENRPATPRNPTIRENLSYAQATKSNTEKADNNNYNNNNTELILNQFLHKFEALFNQLMNQNNILINLLTSLIKNKTI